jgi:methyl-accepting chemotaxis protein
MVIGNITTLEIILDSMREQTKRVENFFAVIGEISAILNDISDKGTVVSGGVVNLNSVITDAKRKSGKNYQLMVAVRNSIESIVHISQTIEKISEDSNILAMNASIESANSGDSGKGFKVVADDLRKLSEMPKSETAKIQIFLN